MLFKIFRKRYSYSLRKITKIAQNTPKYFMEDLRNFIYQTIKENIEFNLENKSIIIGNVE